MEIQLSIIEISLAIGIVTLGSILQGSVGFGLGPFSVPLLLLVNPVFIPGPVLLAALLLTILMFKREKHAVNIKEIKWAVVGRFFGTILGASVLTIVSKNHLSLLFSCVILFSILIFISGIKLKLSNPNLILVGIMSGFMGTTTSIGGPPMGLLYQYKSGPRIRGTLSGIFMIGTVLAIISLIIINKFGVIELQATFVLLPGIIIGYFLSFYTKRILDKGFIRPAVLIASSIAALFLITNYFQ